MKTITLNELKEQLAVEGHDTIWVEVNKDTPKDTIKALVDILSSTNSNKEQAISYLNYTFETFFGRNSSIICRFTEGDYTYFSKGEFNTGLYTLSDILTIKETTPYVDLSLTEFKEVFENRESQLWVLMDDSTDPVVLKELAKMYYKTCLVAEVDSELFIRNIQDAPGVPYYLHLSAYPGGSGFSKAAYYASGVHPIRAVYRIHKDIAMPTDKEKLQHLLDGGVLVPKDGNYSLAKKLDSNGKLVWADNTPLQPIDIIALADSVVYTEPKWYDNIPEQGVMCWVGPSDVVKVPNIVISYAVGMFRTISGGKWECATPLTVDEMVAYTYIPK